VPELEINTFWTSLRPTQVTARQFGKVARNHHQGVHLTTLMKATIDHRYKDKDGTWKSSGSFSRNEIPLAVFCLLKAFAAMVGEDEGEEE